jgi:hypothetical protein
LDEIVRLLVGSSRVIEFNQQQEKQVYQSVNEILNDIRTNNLAMASVKLSIVEWRGKDALYDLGMVYKQQYRLEI